jgi:hypothetical protein
MPSLSYFLIWEIKDAGSDWIIPERSYEKVKNLHEE